MNVVTAKLRHETKTMSNQQVTIEEFESRTLAYGDDIIQKFDDKNDCTKGFIDVAEREGWNLHPTIAAAATLGGKVTRETYNRLKEQTLDRLDEVEERIDGVLLDLHGAMVVEGLSRDAEEDFARAIRDHVGSETPIISTADPHGNISAGFVENIDALFAYDTIPHIDEYERGIEAAETLVEMLDDELDPGMVRLNLPMMVPSGKQLVGYEGATGPLPKIRREADRWEQKADIRNVSVFVGFDRSDVSSVGACIIVVADDHPPIAEKAARAVGDELRNRREDFLLESYSPEKAIRKTQEIDGRPVALVDMEDAPSGGATGDGTEVLRTMMDMKVSDGAIWMADPETVEVAVDVGIGNEISTEIDGKKRWRVDGNHAEPLSINGTVRLLSDGVWTIRGPSGTGTEVRMGRTAVLRVGKIDIVVSERRIDPKDPQLFRSHGIEPMEYNMIVLKSKHHWRAAWEPLLKTTSLCSIPLITRYRRSEYRRGITRTFSARCGPSTKSR